MPIPSNENAVSTGMIRSNLNCSLLDVGSMVRDDSIERTGDLSFEQVKLTRPSRLGKNSISGRETSNRGQSPLYFEPSGHDFTGCGKRRDFDRNIRKACLRG